jgi:hypothetical protein
MQVTLFFQYVINFSGNPMRNLLCLCFVLLSASLAFGMNPPKSATNCHCFKDRSFDTQRKFAADKYLLTTSFNSFISESFHVSKRQIVMMEMQGAVGPDDLLIGLYIARVEKVELKSLLGILDNGGTWQQIFSSISLQNRGEDEVVLKTLQAVGDDKKAAVELITDQLLKEFFKISDSAIDGLRQAGGTGRGITLSYLLEKYGNPKKTASDILAMYTKEKKSWGEVANFFGLTPKETGRLILKGKQADSQL